MLKKACNHRPGKIMAKKQINQKHNDESELKVWINVWMECLDGGQEPVRTVCIPRCMYVHSLAIYQSRCLNSKNFCLCY